MYSYSQPYLLVQVRVQFPHSIVFMRPIKSLLVLVFSRASGNAVSAVRPWDRGWASINTISFPEHARSQVKGGHSSGEIELIQAADWLAAVDFQRELYACLAIVAKYKQSI
jgi:hypothetical protein